MFRHSSRGHSLDLYLGRVSLSFVQSDSSGFISFLRERSGMQGFVRDLF